MANKITEINPLSQLYNELKKILSDIVIKFSVKADSYETLESRKYSDMYIDAVNKTDKFRIHTYTEAEYNDVGITDSNAISFYNENPGKVPKNLQDKLLENRRASIIKNYDEPNDYYRELNGIPPKNDVGAMIVTDIVKRSMIVVEDSDELHKSDFTEHRISESATYRIMNTELFHPGNHIAVFSAIIQNEKTSNRSFFIVPDEYELDKTMNSIYLRDAKTILYILTGTEYPDDKLIAKYLFISVSNALDTSPYFTNGYMVVDDNDPEYDKNKMIKYSEAILNNKNVTVGDHIVLRDFKYVTDYYEEMYGISTKVPIHLIRSYYGKQTISLLESIGFLDEIAKANPDKPYLNFLGSKRIDIITARKAKNFEILFLPPTDRDVVSWMFSVTYNGSRDYFVNTVYNYHYRTIYDYYDNFIGMAIINMAISQLIAKSMQSAIDRDFYDETLVRWLFEMYDVPYSSELPYQTQRRLVKSLNLLIQRKASNQVIYDIASILGYHDVTVYKYYLMKERRFDTDNALVYKDTTTVEPRIDENGNLINETVLINDLDKMYDIYFQKVDLKETNFQNALTDTANRVDYDEITLNDPLWWDDQDTFDEIYGKASKYSSEDQNMAYYTHYNYMETKYLGITISYKMSEVLYENIMLLRLIFDLKDELEHVTLTLPKITGSLEISLFDVIVYLCALTCKQYRLTGEILTKHSSILDVMGYITEDVDGYRPCDTLRFNFDKLVNIESYNEIMKNPSRYLKPNEVAQFENYMSVLTLNQATVKEKIEAFNAMYTNFKDLGYFIGRKMSESENIYEYRAWRDLYDALYIGQETNEMFQLGESGETATTYLEYLEVMNPALYNTIVDAPDYELYAYIDHTISRMEKIIKEIDSLYVMNDSNSSMTDYLIKLIKFFKSYTTDLLNVTTQFVFDARPDNLFKLSEWYGIHHVILPKESYKLMYSDSFKIIDTLRKKDSLIYQDKVYGFNQSKMIKEAYPIHSIKCESCPFKDKKNCGNDKESCLGTYKVGPNIYDCDYFMYDNSGFYSYISTYRDLLLSIGYEDLADLQCMLREHLSWVYETYRIVTSYNVYSNIEPTFEISVLKNHISDSLDNINEILAFHEIPTSITTVAVDEIFKWIDLFMVKDSGIKRICRNDNYPCLETECKRKQDELFTKNIVRPKDKISYAEFFDMSVTTWIDDYRLYTKDEINNMILTVNAKEDSKIFTSDSGRSILYKKMKETTEFKLFDEFISILPELTLYEKSHLCDEVILVGES